MIRLFILLFLCFQVSTPVSAQMDKIQAFYQQAEKASEQPISISFVQPSMQLVEDYDRLEQIIVVRHGEPDLKKKGGFKRTEAMEFIKAYDTVGVKPLSFVPVTLAEGDLTTVYTSSLNRAKHTARLVFGDQVNYKEDVLFREFERKIFGFINLKMPLKFWLINSRIFWLLGGNKKNIEGFKDAKNRAKEATQQLIDYAEKDKKVVLVAHGFLNRYLLKNLQKQGFTLVRNGGSEYLAASLLVRIKENK